MDTEAKETLKKALLYIDNPHTDAVLQGICLNNLANYYKSKGKLWKSLKYSLQGVQIIQIHLYQSKSQPKSVKQQIAILLVVLLIHAKNCSLKIMKNNQSKYLKLCYQFVNYIGYRTCVKYLGKDSVFNQFIETQKHFHLPIFKPEQAKKQPQQRKQDDGKYIQIISQMQKIYEVLKTKQKPQLVVINNQSQAQLSEYKQSEQSIFINNQINEVIIQPKQKVIQPIPSPVLSKKQVQKQSIPIKQQAKKQQPIIQQLFKPLIPTKQNEQCSIPKITINQQPIQQQIIQKVEDRYIQSQQQQSEQTQSLPLIMAQQTISINKWQIKFRIQKQRDHTLGNLIIQTSNKRNRNKQIISEQKLYKICNLINKQDKLPYQILNNQLYQQQFISYLVKPYFNINDHGKVSIISKSIGIIKPFQIKFLNQINLIFLNHIRNNLFRISISPAYSCKSLYLNVQLCQSTMVQYFTFQQQTADFLTAIIKSINKSPIVSIPQKINEKGKICKVINESALLQYINRIIIQFENSLLTREDETSVNEIIQNQLFYYKYQQITKNRLGIYYFIRYLPSINCFDIYLQNNYQTYSIDGKIKSRGNILYRSNQFLQDFGIPLRSAAKNNLFAYIQIIAKKYYLYTFDKPLTQNDYDRYMENAILELSITQNCFRMKLISKNNYYIPIKISLLTINSQTPVGIKINQYDPINCLTKGYFMHIIPSQWVRPYRKPAITLNNILFHTYVNQFPFRSEYFLPQWLEKQGFDLILKKIQDPQSALYLQHNINHLVVGNNLIKIFNKQDST